jgi:hypothetical protein
LVDMIAMSKRSARFTALNSGKNPSFSMNNTALKRLTGPHVGNAVSGIRSPISNGSTV